MTFSIVAFDEATGDLGVAVATRALAVGRVVPWTRAGVGAVATQAAANVGYGPRGLDLLAAGHRPEAVVALLTGDDPDAAVRQLGVVDARGRAATFTGTGCQPWAGGRREAHYACQGNILTSEAVVDAMAATFERTAALQDDLGVRLMAALVAGQAAGGDRRGRQSAALLVVREKGGYFGMDDRYVDLRVDDHPQPVDELARVLDVWRKERHLPPHQIGAATPSAQVAGSTRHTRANPGSAEDVSTATMEGVRVRAVDYVVYHVPDMRAAKAFYRQTLGLSPQGEYTATWAEFDTEPTTLCLRTTHLSPSEAARNPHQVKWVDTPAIALAVDDVYATVERLRGQGVQILVEPWETGVCYKAFIADPFGNPICLHQRKDSTAG